MANEVEYTQLCVYTLHSGVSVCILYILLYIPMLVYTVYTCITFCTLYDIM